MNGEERTKKQAHDGASKAIQLRSTAAIPEASTGLSGTSTYFRCTTPNEVNTDGIHGSISAVLPVALHQPSMHALGSYALKRTLERVQHRHQVLAVCANRLWNAVLGACTAHQTVNQAIK